MTETVVHVTTLEEWKSVLDVWFKQGHAWSNGDKEYSKHLFKNGGRFLFLDDYITWSTSSYNSEPFIEYSEFVAQQKEDSEVETYYVTKEQLDLIKDLKKKPFPLYDLLTEYNKYKNIKDRLDSQGEKALLRCLGGDISIEFKVKEQLYRLWRIDDDGDIVYMMFGIYGTPTWTPDEGGAFTAPLEEIKKWKTPAWDIEEAV